MKFGYLIVIAGLAVSLGCARPMAAEQTPEEEFAARTAPPAMPPGPGRAVNIGIMDFTFSPSEIQAKPGEKLNLTVANGGKNEHSMVFDFPWGPVQLPSDVQPNGTEQYSIVVPTLPGTYYFHCPVGNHYSRGMIGKIVVQ